MTVHTSQGFPQGSQQTTAELLQSHPNLKLVHAEGSPRDLVLEAQESGQGIAILTQGQDNPVGKVALPLPDNVCVTVFEGKGGIALEITLGGCDSANAEAVLFVLPGGVVTHPSGWAAELFGETYSPDHRPVKPQSDSSIGIPQSVTHQATVLSAGIGTRILPLTTEEIKFSKPALPLDGHHTVIGRIMESLEVHGFTSVLVNTFYQRDSVREAIDVGASTIQVHEIKEARATGTAGGLWTALAQAERYPGAVDTTKPILVVQGDAVTNTNFSKLLEAHQTHSAAITIGCQRVDDADVSKFGIMATDSPDPNGDPSGNIVSFLEKPSLEEAGPHRLGSTGFYVIAPQVYPVLLQLYGDMLAQAQEKARSQGQSEPTEVEEIDFAKHLFPRVMELSQARQLTGDDGEPLALRAQQVHGYWSDIGNPGQYYTTLRDIYAGLVDGFELPQDLDQFYSTQGAVFWPGTMAVVERHDFNASGAVVVGKPYMPGMLK